MATDQSDPKPLEQNSLEQEARPEAKEASPEQPKTLEAAQERISKDSENALASAQDFREALAGGDYAAAGEEIGKKTDEVIMTARQQAADKIRALVPTEALPALAVEEPSVMETPAVPSPEAPAPSVTEAAMVEDIATLQEKARQAQLKRLQERGGAPVPMTPEKTMAEAVVDTLPSEDEQEAMYAAWLEANPETPVERRESGPEVEQFEGLLTAFEAVHSLEALNAITDLTPEQAPFNQIREAAKKGLEPIVAKLNVLFDETNITEERHKEMKAKYMRLSRAVGMISKGKVDHTR